MRGSVATIKTQISKAGPDDKRKGWIRVSDDLRKDNFGKEIPNGAYVQLIANKMKVYCQIRGTPGKTGRVEMNEWYRNTLGWRDPPKGEVELIVKKVRSLRRISAWSRHPDDIVRVGIALGLISIGLGLLSILIVSVPPAIHLMASSVLSYSIGGLVCVVIEAILSLIVLFLLGNGLWILLSKLPKPIDPEDS